MKAVYRSSTSKHQCHRQTTQEETIQKMFYTLFLLATLAPTSADYPFRNTSLPWSERVDDLVGRLTLEEIQYQMISVHVTPGIDRLGIPPYFWFTECIHGDATDKGATSFPQSIGLGAAFSTELIKAVAEASSTEVRAFFNTYSSKPNEGEHFGLSCFSPVINLVRDPRWGRNQETYGEDPHLTGAYAAAYVAGIQGDHPRYLRANAGCKHFVGYDGPESIPSSRFSFNAEISERDLRTTFLPAFRQCVKAGTYNIMCSYNSINGIPGCANKYTLTTILRDQWNFTGYVVSDGGALQHIIDAHHYVDNNVDCTAASINAGVNLNLGDTVFNSTVEAVRQGKVSEGLVRERVKKLFYTRMRLGIFDPPEMNPYTKINMSVVESAEHWLLARDAAMQTFVLLRNTNGFLPIKGIQKKISIIGPFANNSVDIMGDYAPSTDNPTIFTVFEGLLGLGRLVSLASVCDGVKCTTYNQQDIKDSVKDSNIVFVCLGTGQGIETEGMDRSNLELPGQQNDVLADTIRFSDENTTIVLLLFNAGPVNITWLEFEPRVTAILECFLPAQATGVALQRVLTNEGPHSVPAGRLPYTWPRYDNQIPPMVNYSMTGRTYRYFTGEPLYPFGYGLSYVVFKYSELKYSKSIKAGEDLTGSVVVSNTGTMDADEVVQVYIKWETTDIPTPNIQLAAFNRVTIPAGQQMKVDFRVTAETMAVWMDVKGWVVEKGTYSIYAGGQQPNQKQALPSNVLSGEFKTFGSKILGHF